jgi:integrase
VKESGAILSRIVHELGVEHVEELSRSRVKAWREQRLKAGASNKTVNNQLAVLLAALSEAVEDELIPSHPLAGLRSLPVGPRHQRRKPRALADFEIAKLLAALADMDANPPPEQRPRVPQELLVRVLLETGARWGELTAATWADADTAAAVLTFRAENTKTDTERAIPLRRETCERLVAYRLECAAVTGTMPASGAPIFLSPKGRPWTSGSNFRKVLGVAYERAGLLERDERGRLKSRDGHALHVHTLRHTCCTRLLSAGVPVPIVQALLGHASPQMTLRVYSHLRAESARVYVEAAGLTPSVAALRVSVDCGR